MKRLFFICISYLFCINCLADETVIRFYKSDSDEKVKDKRSLSLEPTSSLNGNTLCIHTNLPVEYLQIVVTDSFNNTVYSNNDATCSRSHIFELNTLPKGEYIVSLTIGDESFYGHFSKYDI